MIQKELTGSPHKKKPSTTSQNWLTRNPAITGISHYTKLAYIA